MPAKSKSQFRFLQGVASGTIKAKGMTKAEAKEFVSGQKNYKKLPEKAKKAKGKK
jgi:hypothetical protein